MHLISIATTRYTEPSQKVGRLLFRPHPCVFCSVARIEDPRHWGGETLEWLCPSSLSGPLTAISPAFGLTRQVVSRLLSERRELAVCKTRALRITFSAKIVQVASETLATVFRMMVVAEMAEGGVIQ